MMRALGPGSVSSILKAALDAASVLIWIGLVALCLVFLAALIAQPFIPDSVADALTQGARDSAGDGGFSVKGNELNGSQVLALIRSPAIPVGLFILILYLGGLATITRRLRRVFQTLTRGDPFHPENGRRLRQIGFALALLEVINQIASEIVFALLPEDIGPERFGISFNFTAWFSVAVVFVLAEVFREGARLRREAELTI